MKSRFSSIVSAGALAGLFGLLTAAPVAAGILLPFPEGDLTVTVQELANGGVRISLSGTATVQDLPFQFNSEEVLNTFSGITRTNYSAEPSPPSPAGEFSLPLPEGLSLTFDDSGVNLGSEDETRGLFLPTSQFSVPLDEVVFPAGNWCLGTFEVEVPYPGTTITGSGSVTANDVPFYLFVPGTYRVGPPYLIRSEVEAAEPGEPTYASGQDEYLITYVVIPFIPAPEIRLSKPARFPTTKVRRSARNQEVTITNTGNTPLIDLAVMVSGPASKEFSSTSPRGGVLEPGESTRVSVGFRPQRKGLRRATLSVTAVSEYKRVIPTSEVETAAEEIPVEETLPVPVSDAVALEGTGVIPRSSGGQPNSPRFPRGQVGFSN